MITRKSLAVFFALAGITVAAATMIAGAQTPKQNSVVRVASNTIGNDKKPAAPVPTAAVPAPAPAQKAAPSELLINRETFSYGATGRRDPFVSLMNTEELRPLFNDLKLVAVALDPTGRNSVAVLRDVTTKEQYRVKVGQELGRMCVASIQAKSVVFGIEEFGYSRQESLAMTVDSTKVRTQ
jgi:hypothetical protein